MVVLPSVCIGLGSGDSPTREKLVIVRQTLCPAI